MAQNRYYSSIAPPTTLAAAITSSGATTISVNSISGLPSSYPFTMLIDWGLSTQEAVSATAAPTGTGPYTLTVTRGIDGTTAQTHSSGAVIVHGVTAEDYNEPQVHIADIAGVHGVTGNVVGTTDTQTLSNKTLSGASVSGKVNFSMASANGGLLSITNSTATPTAPNVQWVAAGNTDSVLGANVAGDTTYRFQLNSAGKMQWGPGGASAVDVDLYRSAVGVLSTDNALTATAGLQVGSATPALAGASTGIGLTNAVTPPSTSPAGGAVAYAKSGYMKVRAADGLDYQSGPYVAYLTTPFTSTTTGSYVSVTGLTAAIGIGTYLFEAWALFSQAATTGTVIFSVNGPTTSTLAYSSQTWIGSTLTESNQVAYNTGTATGTLTASTDYLVKVQGLLVSTATGTLALTYEQSAAGTFSVLAGSYLKVTAVA